SRLLCDENCPEVILSTLLHPFHKRTGLFELAAEDTLCLFEHGDYGDDRLSAGEVLLIMGKDPAEHQSGKHTSSSRAQEANVYNHDQSCPESLDRPAEKRAIGIVQHSHHAKHIAACCSDLSRGSLDLLRS